MRYPQRPPQFEALLKEIAQSSRMHEVLLYTSEYNDDKYLHWEDLRKRPAPEAMNHGELWLAIKFKRKSQSRPVPLLDKHGQPFVFSMPPVFIDYLHRIDCESAGNIEFPEGSHSTRTSERYIISSLMEESISSSQLEGAATTRSVAKEMLRTQRKPLDRSEWMILNNYRAIRKIRDWQHELITPERIIELQRILTTNTLDNPEQVGRLRREDEIVNVEDELTGEVFHAPPHAAELPKRLQMLCQFANEDSATPFIHPVIRAIILHFWLAYDHPFNDGNGRTARALFYWSMLKQGHWFFEYISISQILKKAPVKYARAFLLTETDDNDLNYFILYQLNVIQRAIKELINYVHKKAEQWKQLEASMHGLALFNHRQQALLSHALRHQDARYTVESHQSSHSVAYQTARTDLLKLEKAGLLKKRVLSGNAFTFIAPDDLEARLRSL